METKDGSLNWEWQDELLATLDADSTLGTTHTLWEDIHQSEGDVNEMLETTPASKFSGPDHDFVWEVKAKHDSPGNLIMEDSPLIKRRRMLQFENEEDVGLFACNSSLETSPFSSLENYSDIYGAHQSEDTQMLEPECSSSIWFNNNFGGNAKVEKSNGSSWLNGSLREREYEPKQFQERGNRQEMPVIIESALCKTKTRRSMSSIKMATPVAYPFTVVKPSGIQGDVTLKDINKRIMMAHDELGGHKRSGVSTRTCDSRRGDEAFASNLLEKSMVAFTKIHTEGNGTITIMRTKN